MFSVCRTSTAVKHIHQMRHIGTIFKADRLFVNYLKWPEFLNFHGPTGEEVVKDVDLTGKTCLITGGTSGIGLEMTKCLLARNCNMVMAIRNPYSVNKVLNNLSGEEDYGTLKVYDTNLASLASVKKCADRLIQDNVKLDIVILNAAVFGIPWTLTEDKLETIFQVNFLSQYYLLMCIEKLLTKFARVVIMSSESHRNIRWTLQNTLFPTEDLLSLPEDEYTSIRAYNISKLCGLHAMHYLAYRWLKSGKCVLCAHPGSFIKTNLCNNWWPYEVLYTAMLPFSKSIPQAASTPLYCATAPEIQNCSGFYFKDMRQIDESDLAKDTHLCFKVMELCQHIINDRIGTDEIITETKVIDQVERKKAPVEPSKPTIAEPLFSS